MVVLKKLAAVLLFLLTVAGAVAYTYEASGNGFTIRDSDSECTSTTCVVYPLVCNDRSLALPAVSVAVDFEVLEPTKLAVAGEELRYAPVESIVTQNLDLEEKGFIELRVDEPKARYALEAPADFAPLECKVIATTIHPVFGGVYKYSVFANGFELDPLVNATRYEIGNGTGATWADERNDALSTVTLSADNFTFFLGVLE